MNTERTPIIGVSAFVEYEGKILVVRRGQSPNRGQLAFPGGKVRWGERLTRAVVRELREETTLIARAAELLHAVDIIVPAADGEAIARHFVVLCFRCYWQSGTARACDDASEVLWLTPRQLQRHPDVAHGVLEVLEKTGRI